jgi:hypothetical protein
MTLDTRDQRNQVKRKLRMLVLGPYDEKVKSRLENLKTRLINEGYELTRLVSDFMDDPLILKQKGKDVYYTEKSWKYILHWSDLNIFVLFRDIDNDGVVSEFVIYCTNDCQALGKLIHESGKRLSTQVKGPAMRKGVPIASFTNEDELFKESRAVGIDYVDKYYYFLLNR